MTVGDISYVCRLYGEEYHGLRGVQVMKCARCERQVVATPSVLAEKRAVAYSLGRGLEVICDDCFGPALAENAASLVEFPDEAAMAEAQRLGGDPW